MLQDLAQYKRALWEQIDERKRLDAGVVALRQRVTDLDDALTSERSWSSTLLLTCAVLVVVLFVGVVQVQAWGCFHADARAAPSPEAGGTGAAIPRTARGQEPSPVDREKGD